MERKKEEFEPHQTFSLIMADTSGNQFVFGVDDDQAIARINAKVDLDAYVIVPRELGLVILNECITDEKLAIICRRISNNMRNTRVREILRSISFLCFLR
ncbi:hypothetical protein [Ornithinibacillus scapharcae]|uniref:hypothetical protein n=1 Tax=Ornithinibacillus scapharcae TaxID=1147159 RepID=UPI000225BD66|nr:hypothetical protein [Ornithinibacillus scapharcae]